MLDVSFLLQLVQAMLPAPLLLSPPIASAKPGLCPKELLGKHIAEGWTLNYLITVESENLEKGFIRTPSHELKLIFNNIQRGGMVKNNIDLVGAVSIMKLIFHNVQRNMAWLKPISTWLWHEFKSFWIFNFSFSKDQMNLLRF